MSLNAAQIGDFLKDNPDFLQQNPGILAFVHLPPNAGGRNVASLHDRQMQTMRERLKKLEGQLCALSRAAVENELIVQSVQALQRRLLMVQNPDELPALLENLIRQHFKVPMVRLLLWRDAPQITDEDRAAIDSIERVFCGFAEKSPSLCVFQSEEIKPRSVAVIPLRLGSNPVTFGCLGLGTLDRDRFSPDLETDFLSALAETAGACLSRLQSVRT